MDSITQGLLGGVVGQALFGPKYGKRAGWVAAVGAMAPDLDILIRSSTNPIVAFQFHRHFTHSALFVPVGGLIVAALLYPVWRNRIPAAVAWLIAAVGYATHAPLDICTSYGTQYFWPFSDVRLTADWVGIIDLFYSVPLLIGWWIAARHRTARPAWLALTVTTAYLAFGGWQHHRAETAQADLAASRGHTIERARAMPAPFTLLLWRSLYAHDGRYYVDGIRVPFFGEPEVFEGSSVEAASSESLVASLPASSAQVEDIQIFDWFADGWLYRDTRGDGRIGDLRYGLLPNSTDAIWGISLQPETPDAHVERWSERNARSEAFATFWDMLTGSYEAPAE
jgi:inner membrane protein